MRDNKRVDSIKTLTYSCSTSSYKIPELDKKISGDKAKIQQSQI
jgi:hypothetical protein